MSIQDIQTTEQNLCYEKTYPVKYYEMDFNKKLKPSALLNFLQDMATENAEMLGFGPSFVFAHNYAWFLIKYRMEFDKYPQNIDEIVIKTESRGVSKILARRDFELKTTESQILGRVSSNWMLVDLETKNALAISKVMPALKALEKREGDLQFAKIAPLQRVDFEKVFEIRYDDIDVNRHVNNANYIIWAFETLPADFRAQNSIKMLDITYKKEISLGHKVVSQSELDADNKISTHILKNASTGEELCALSVLWD